MEMPSQNLLVEDYKKFQLQFVICDSCFWCATSLSYSPDKCPSCGSRLTVRPLQPTVRCSKA